MTIEQILTYLTPFLLLFVTWLVTKVRPLIPGWLTLTFVTIVSAVLAWITQLLATPELSWFWQFILGMVSIIIYQFLKQFSPSKIASDKAKK
jgi:hypothetical protein